MSLVHNEQTKLTASWLNTLATALLAAGVFAPGAAVLYGISNFRVGSNFIAAILCGCMTFGVLIHLAARRLLGRLRE